MSTLVVFSLLQNHWCHEWGERQGALPGVTEAALWPAIQWRHPIQHHQCGATWTAAEHQADGLSLAVLCKARVPGPAFCKGTKVSFAINAVPHVPVMYITWSCSLSKHYPFSKLVYLCMYMYVQRRITTHTSLRNSQYYMSSIKITTDNKPDCTCLQGVHWAVHSDSGWWGCILGEGGRGDRAARPGHCKPTTKTLLQHGAQQTQGQHMHPGLL